MVGMEQYRPQSAAFYTGIEQDPFLRPTFPRYLLPFFFNDTATTEIYTTAHTLSLHDALPISAARGASTGRSRCWCPRQAGPGPRRSRRSEEHTSELQSRTVISYAVFCLK